MKKLLNLIILVMVFALFMLSSGCKKGSETTQITEGEQSFEEILTSEKWKAYSGGNEVTYEFNQDGTGQYSNSHYTPTKFKWTIKDDKLLWEYEDSDTSEYLITNNEGVYQLKRIEETQLYSGEYVITRQSEFDTMYDFEDRVISKAEFDVFLIYNSNFSHGNYVEVYVTGVENFGNVYTVSGKAKYQDETYKSYTGTFEIQYSYDGENLNEIDNYFSTPR